MGGFSAFLEAIPSAAASPLALVTYLAAVGAWLAIAWRLRIVQAVSRALPDLPKNQRADAIKLALNRAVPPNLTPEQFLRGQRDFYILIGFIAICVVVVVIAAISVSRVYNQSKRSDELIRQILGSPPTAAMSAANMLANGETMIKEAATEIKPPLSNAQLSDLVDRWAMQHVPADEINRRLAEYSGAGRLKQANNALARAAGTLNAQYKDLADCFWTIQCRPGDEFERMCTAVKTIRSRIAAINQAAQNIPGLNSNASGGPPLLGGGSMDIDFNMIVAPNVDYLATEICKSN
jgi:hypothetical protein